MKNPGHITLNNHRITVQRWQQSSTNIEISTVIRGEKLALDLMRSIQDGQNHLIVDAETRLVGYARIIDQRTTGSGPTAVVRLVIGFQPDGAAASLSEMTEDDKLDLILEELRSLRQEVRALHGDRFSRTPGEQTLTRPGTTLLDFEIPTDPEEPEGRT